MEIFEIADYRLNIIFARSHDHIVMLYDKNRLVARLFFRKDQETVHITKADNVYSVIYNTRHYPSVVDLLRNEKPVYFHYYESGATLSTSREPVGEAEMGLS